MTPTQSIVKGKWLCLSFIPCFILNIILFFIADSIDGGSWSDYDIILCIKLACFFMIILAIWFCLFKGFQWARIAMNTFLIIYVILFLFASIEFSKDLGMSSCFIICTLSSGIYLMLSLFSKDISAYMSYTRPKPTDEWLLNTHTRRGKLIYFSIVCILIVLLIIFNIINYDVWSFTVPFTVTIGLLLFFLYQGYTFARIILTCISSLIFIFLLINISYGDFMDVLITLIICTVLLLLTLTLLLSKDLLGFLFLRRLNRP